MKTTIQFVRIPRSETLETYALKKLEKIYEKYTWMMTSNVFFKKENDPKGKGKICELEVRVPGSILYATSNETQFEAAFKETLSDIEKQLKKRKGELKPYL